MTQASEPASSKPTENREQDSDDNALICPDCKQEIDEVVASDPFFWATCRHCDCMTEITLEQWITF